MDPTAVLTGAHTAVKEIADRLADLVGSISDVGARIPDSEWTVRDACAHLVVVAPLYRELVAGRPSPCQLPGNATGHDGRRYREVQAAFNAESLAGVADDEPSTLAGRLREETARLVEVTSAYPADHPVTFHCRVPLESAGLVCLYLGELLVHGYDMATAAGRPWPIDPGHATLVLSGYGPCLAMTVDRARTEGHSAGYGIELRGVTEFVVRFRDGEYGLESGDSTPVNCTISADPVAWLLVATGRLSLWSAISLGLISAGGDDPGLALGFKDLFVFP